jgi:hypothetical protein
MGVNNPAEALPVALCIPDHFLGHPQDQFQLFAFSESRRRTKIKPAFRNIQAFHFLLQKLRLVDSYR